MSQSFAFDTSATHRLIESRIAALADDVDGLVSPPEICIKLEQLLNDDTASTDDFGDIIALDPSLTARVLKLANSAHYSFAGRIDTVSRAISILGTTELTSLCYAVSGVATFSKISNDLTNVRIFWQHAAYCALLAKALARKCNVLHPERFFVAGMLHDVGTLVLQHRYPEECAHIISEADGSESRISELEYDTFGFNHAELGARILEQWNLPDTLCTALRHHHDGYMTADMRDAAIMYVADTLTAEFGAGVSGLEPDQFEIPEHITEMIGLPYDFDRDALFDEISPEFVDTVYTLLT